MTDEKLNDESEIEEILEELIELDEVEELEEVEEKEPAPELKEAKVEEVVAPKKSTPIVTGTKETKEVLRFIYATLKTVKLAKENDGVISKNDLMLLANMYPYIGPAFNDVGKVIGEIKDLDEAELKDLVVFTGMQLSDIADKGKQMEILAAAVEAAVALIKVIGLIAKEE